MRLKKISFPLLAAGLLLANSSANAQDWYFGVGFGNSSVDVSGVEGQLNDLAATANSLPGVNAIVNVDDSDTGIKIFSGVNMSENLAFEFGYADLGEVSLDFSLTDDGSFSGTPGSSTVSETDSVSGFYGAAIGKAPLSDLVTLSGRLGVLFWDLETDLTSVDTTGFFGSYTESGSDSGNDIFYGAALAIGWFEIFYDVYDIDGDDVDLMGVSVKFGF